MIFQAGRRSGALRRGVTLLELLFATGIATLMLLTSLSMLEHDGNLSRSTLGISVTEVRAQELLYKLERELADSRGATPIAELTRVLTGGQTDEMLVDSTLGFPDRGILLIHRGTSLEERLSYDGAGGGGVRFMGLERGLQCTGDFTHDRPAAILWAALGEVLQNQSNPPASAWDGRAMEFETPTFFRGDGTGFSYRIPVGVLGDDIQWGARMNNGLNPDAWHALVYVPQYQLVEADTGDDLNRDGDLVDVYDVGQIRRRSWDTTNPAIPANDLGMGPTVILQEQCNWGGDLDGDGFDDPIFLWNEVRRMLHVRLFVIGNAVRGVPIVRQVESTVFMRN